MRKNYLIGYKAIKFPENDGKSKLRFTFGKQISTIEDTLEVGPNYNTRMDDCEVDNLTQHTHIEGRVILFMGDPYQVCEDAVTSEIGLTLGGLHMNRMLLRSLIANKHNSGLRGILLKVCLMTNGVRLEGN